MKSVAFAGLGAMGKPIAKNLLQAGYSVTVFDICQEVVQELISQGAQGAANPREAASGKDIILMSLPNAAIVENVLLQEAGLLAGSHQGQIIIDLSSVTPGHTQKMAKLAAAKGVHYLDAPVSGGVAGASAGTLTIMVGGEAAVLEDCRELLNVIGKKIYHVGPVGAGDTMKLVNNLLLGINMVAVTEALTLGAKAGLDPNTMLEVISVSSGRSYALEAKVPGFILPGSFEPGFAIDLQHKDLAMAIQTAEELGIPLKVGNMAQAIYEEAQVKGLGRKDISAVITLLEERVGVSVRTKK
ncbi:2-(hydroxymethyl)glutarate dehydrogenase [Sporomusa silvacetica DSM 10669]|uniref:2-(Hydroxymethyl)glutarate dehydrogenase n=1 Tax=Sporomusa silvacetica DSM 10669 TaxID=1123289 RepID=A0ABZ3IJD4_9FIRM|nr:NAD(P)-dependent oxidoreductase [Sporomusa silvacetica]OZC18886.1 2-(hydroxymethyl)glutarate dehydrogenase [Sporomusa silvacetica DSM 10669]